jgi:hypothetical protein
MVRARTVALLLCAAALTTIAYADDEPYEPRPDADAEPEEAAEPEPKIPEGPKFDYMDPDTWSHPVWNYSRVAHDDVAPRSFCLHAGPSRRSTSGCS